MNRSWSVCQHVTRPHAQYFVRRARARLLGHMLERVGAWCTPCPWYWGAFARCNGRIRFPCSCIIINRSCQVFWGPHTRVSLASRIAKWHVLSGHVGRPRRERGGNGHAIHARGKRSILLQQRLAQLRGRVLTPYLLNVRYLRRVVRRVESPELVVRKRKRRRRQLPARARRRKRPLPTRRPLARRQVHLAAAHGSLCRRRTKQLVP